MASPDVPAAGSRSGESKAKLKRVARRAGYWLIDWVWPVLQPRTPEEERREQDKRERKRKEAVTRAEAITGDYRNKQAAADALAECKALLAADVARRTTVESRLSSVVALTSVAVALTLGILTSQLGKSFEIPALRRKWGRMILPV